ncbi:MAG: dockerin type I domain-containing protein [Planctomycetota bacterium]
MEKLQRYERAISQWQYAVMVVNLMDSEIWRKAPTVICVLVLLMAGGVYAVVIDGTEYPVYTSIDDDFSSQGVLFSSNLSFVTFGYNGGGDGQGTAGVFGTDPNFSGPSFGYLSFSAPIIVTFVDPADGSTAAIVNGTVSVVAGDGGGDFDYIRMRAYNIFDNLLGTVNSSGKTWQTINLTGNGIHKVIIDQQAGAPATSDTFLDSLTFPNPQLPPIGDWDGSGSVDFVDFSLLAEQWGTSGPGGRTGDLNGDGDVDMQDLYIFVQHWLEGK